jgi:hypothetical protein
MKLSLFYGTLRFIIVIIINSPPSGPFPEPYETIPFL